MQKCEDESVFDWIRDQRSTTAGRYDDPDWKGNPVSVVLPPIFPRYVKILHRLDAHYENIDNPLSPEELLILKIPECSVLRELVLGLRGSGSTRVRWKRVADALGLEFGTDIIDEWFRAVLEPGCWPRFIYGPNDGWLDAEEGKSLVAILRQLTADGAIYLRMAEIPLVGTETPLLYKGHFDDVLKLLQTERSNMLPEYWWPSDHAWCVCSDYDLTFTLVGGSSELCQRLLDDDVLECVEVRPETRVDYRSPPQLLRT